MRIRPLISIFLIFFSACSRDYNFRPELQKRLDAISAEKELSYNGSSDISYLQDSCSKKELLLLLRYSTPIVRILAYRAIVNRNEPDFFSILLNHLSDTSKITWWYFDDASSEYTISDLMIIKAERKLDRQQKDTLIDLVLKGHMYLQSASWMIEDIKANDRYYEIIRQEAIKKKGSCNQERAVYALSKFKKQNDITLIKKAISGADDNCEFLIFKTIETFPDTSFFVFLKRYFETNIKRERQSSYNDLDVYCRAVAQYRNKDALKILQALTEKETYPDDWYLPENKEYVFKSINRYNCSLYNRLFKSLKPQMSKDVFADIQLPFRETTAW